MTEGGGGWRRRGDEVVEGVDFGGDDVDGGVSGFDELFHPAVELVEIYRKEEEVKGGQS